MEDVKELLYLYDLEGKQLKKFDLPMGTVEVHGKKDRSEIFIGFTSFLHPTLLYRYDIDTDDFKLYWECKIDGFDASQFEINQVFYKSKDGTEIPMFVMHRKGINMNGSNGCLLYGYGGFNISITPSFSTLRLTYLNHFNGIFVIANIRGGGEYGEDHHKMGIREKKQNVFDDFQYAAEFLINQKYTSAKKLAIMGGSNGGLLVGACINQRPDLYGAAVASVGVMDMLRFHKFTIGHAWCSDYGDPDVKEDFEFIFKYSPVHNVIKDANIDYPATMLTTGDHDDRVVPLHTFKYISELQHHHPNNKFPLVMRVDIKAGHGGGKPTEKVIEESADKYSFIAYHTGLKWE